MSRVFASGRPLLWALLLGLLGVGSACTGLGREINQALPEFLRSDPGAGEMAIFQEVRQTREWTKEDLAQQDAQLAEVRRLRQDGEFGSAADRLKEYLEQYPGSAHDEEARFLLGNSFYQDDSWNKAFKAWKDLAALHPVSDYNAAVIQDLYHMGEEFLAGNRSTFLGLFSQEGTGVKIFNYLIETFPNGPRAADAQYTLARYYLDDDRWADAEAGFQFLVDHYPESEWRPAALFYVGYAQYRRVKGSVYDPRLMAKARNSFEAYLTQVEDGQWKGEASDSARELQELEAEHLYRVGTWYVGKGKPYAARYYLMSVVTRFPDTTAAGQSEDLLAETEALLPEEIEAGRLPEAGAAPDAGPPPEPGT